MRAGRCDPPPTLQSNREQRFISVTLRACESFHVLRPHPEEPERSEGVSKDGRESESVAMVRDGTLRVPPHHEAERIGTRAKFPKIERFTRSEVRPRLLQPGEPRRATAAISPTWPIILRGPREEARAPQDDGDRRASINRYCVTALVQRRTVILPVQPP